jgi:hypothetical protein
MPDDTFLPAVCVSEFDGGAGVDVAPNGDVLAAAAAIIAAAAIPAPGTWSPESLPSPLFEQLCMFLRYDNSAANARAA